MSGSDGWSEEILRQLDEAAEQFMLPGLPNEYYHQAGMRMTAFRSADEWLVVFEVLGWATKEFEFQNTVSAYGNKVEQVGHQADPAVVTGPGGALLWEDDGDFKLDDKDFEVEIDGKSHRFEPSAADYKKAGLPAGGKKVDPARIIRLIAHEKAGELFFPDKKLLELAGRSGSGPKRFLQVDDWQLPDLVKGEKPSDLECFRTLASALEEGKKGLYSCQKSHFNTHWSNSED